MHYVSFLGLKSGVAFVGMRAICALSCLLSRASLAPPYGAISPVTSREISLLTLQSIWPETWSSGGRDGSIHSLPSFPQSSSPESRLVLVLAMVGNCTRMGTIWSGASETLPVPSASSVSAIQEKSLPKSQYYRTQSGSIRQCFFLGTAKSHVESLYPSFWLKWIHFLKAVHLVIRFISASGNFGQKYQFQNMISSIM